MCPQLPENIKLLGEEELNKAALRVAVMEEFEIINTYEQILAVVASEPLKGVFSRLIEEEKRHATELQDLLRKKESLQENGNNLEASRESVSYQD